MKLSTLPSTSRSGRRANAAWRRRGLIGLAALVSYSTAVGWQAQSVSYPLYRSVDPGSFAAYHAQYNHSIPLVVVLPGFVGFAAATSFYWTRPAEVPKWAAAVVSLSGVVSLISTVAWAIPMHDRLDRIGQSPDTIDSLLRANLVRSVALTTGAVTLWWCLSRLVAGRRTDSGAAGGALVD